MNKAPDRSVTVACSDIADYFLAHAPCGDPQSTIHARGTVSRNRGSASVARVYHLSAKEAAYISNVEHLDDFRKARRLERAIGNV